MTPPFNTRYIYLVCYVLVAKDGGIRFDREEIAVDSEISSLDELAYFENMFLQRSRDQAVRCSISTSPYLLRIEQLKTDSDSF